MARRPKARVALSGVLGLAIRYTARAAPGGAVGGKSLTVVPSRAGSDRTLLPDRPKAGVVASMEEDVAPQ